MVVCVWKNTLFGCNFVNTLFLSAARKQCYRDAFEMYGKMSVVFHVFFLVVSVFSVFDCFLFSLMRYSLSVSIFSMLLRYAGEKKIHSKRTYASECAQLCFFPLNSTHFQLSRFEFGALIPALRSN